MTRIALILTAVAATTAVFAVQAWHVLDRASHLG